MSLHVRIPPEAAAAGLREPQPVHGPFLPVSQRQQRNNVKNGTNYVSLSFQRVCFFFVSLREFKRDFLELLRRRFGEFQ